jgi:thymidylate synthase
VELAVVQGRAAAALELPVGRLVMIVKSAHVYSTEREYMTAVVAAQGDN